MAPPAHHAAVGGAAVLIAALVGALAWNELRTEPDPAAPTLASATAMPGALAPGSSWSNVVRTDYVGPATCGSCHAANHEAWKKHPHRFMNQTVSDAAVVGDFSGVEIAYQGFHGAGRNDTPSGRARFHREDSEYLVSFFTPESEYVRRYRVTRTVGSRVEQMYIGVQVDGPEAKDDDVYTVERRLPFGWDVHGRRWLTVPYFDEDYTVDAEGTSHKDPRSTLLLDDWDGCMVCHNTYPYEKRLQLPSKQSQGFSREDMRGPMSASIKGAKLHEDELVTLGISCEACHLGGREHAEHGAKIRFVPGNANLAVSNPALTSFQGAEYKNPFVVNSLCGQCHGRKRPQWPDGGSTTNSSEAFDMQGACAGQLKCTDCHNPHVAGPRLGSGGPDDPKHLATCTSCHQKYASESGATAHGRHPVSAGVTCMDCHMPRIVGGLTVITRTHRVNSPTDPRAYTAGTPNACNLCHLDRSFGWTMDALAAGWGVRVDAPRPPEVASGLVWSNSPALIVRQVAAEALSRHRMGGESPQGALLGILLEEYPRTRYLGLKSVERLLGRPLSIEEYDVAAPLATRRAQVEALRRMPQAH